MANILVVDDSQFMRLTLKSIIEKSGKHKVVGEGIDDVTALQKYTELKPDVVTMDIIMPVESGLNAVKSIIAKDPAAKIVMVSSMGQEKIIEEAIALGAKSFVVKPVSPEKLIESIERAITQ
jgi:two-component system chemotaxis response regulator CheY